MHQTSHVWVWSVVGCLLAGCSIVHEHTDSYSLEFSWKLNGLSCEQEPDVHGMQIRIAGEILQNGGYFPCAAHGFSGVKLKNFFPGTYSYTVEALDSERNILYSAWGSVEISRGNAALSVPVDVDLLPVLSDISLSWQLMANTVRAHSCKSIAVAHVLVRIDGEERGRFPCQEGESPSEAVSIPNVRLGKRLLEVDAEAAGGEPFGYRGTFINYERSMQKVSVQLFR